MKNRTKLKKTQNKIVEYFKDKPYGVSREKVCEDLSITNETLQMNLRTLDDMNVLERVRFAREITVYINSESDWQVYQVNKHVGSYIGARK